jgi:SAM-dependent methyltransferase
MHPTALISGESFIEIYGGEGKTVIDLGGKDVNGSLRSICEKNAMKYICVDMEEHESVDVVVKPGEKLPFEDNTIDLIVSTSCFEHDPCFWLTFREMTRIIKKDGFIYVNAPTSGQYHGFPGDNWRFYSDAGQALAYWSGFQMSNETVYPVKVIETFNVLGNVWNDFICVWQRTDTKETQITVHSNVLKTIGILEKKINEKLQTRKRVNFGLQFISPDPKDFDEIQ